MKTKSFFYPLISLKEVPKENLAFIACPICGSKENRVIKKNNGWPIVSCQGCSFKFSNIRVKEKIINSYYKNRQKNYNNGINPNHLLFAGKRVFFETILKQMSKNFKKENSGVNFIEIGSGNGEFINFLNKETLWKVRGYEPCSDIKKKNIITADFLDAHIKSNSVDIIFSASVLEHIYRPVDLFRKSYDALKRGGIFISTGIPNYKSLANHLKFKNFQSDCPPTHVNFFDRYSLIILLQKTGFKNIEIKTYGLTNKVAKKKIKNKLNPIFEFYLSNILRIPHFGLGDKLFFKARK